MSNGTTEQDILNRLGEEDSTLTDVETSSQPAEETSTPSVPSSDGDMQASTSSTAESTAPQPAPQLAEGVPAEYTPQPGAERRLYERTQVLRKQNDDLQRQLQELQDSHADTSALNGAPASLGLSDEEVKTGLSAIAAFKKDPVNTTRWMIQQALGRGASLQDIVGDAAATQRLEMNAVKNMLDERLAPLLQDRQRDIEAQEQEQLAEQDYNNFVAEHDYADLHGDVIADLIEQKNWTPEKAYYELRMWAMNNGYDFSQPLVPQMQQPEPTPQPQRRAQSSRPVPSGTSEAAIAARDDVAADGFLYDASTDWDNIVREEMKRAGW